MSPVDITAIVGVIVTVASSLVVPAMLRRRARQAATDGTELASWTSLTAALARERDLLQQRVERIDTDHRTKITAIEQAHAVQLAELEHQLTAARNRITTLESEVADLYVRLGRRSP